MELYFWIIIGALLLVSLTIYFARPPPSNTNTYNYDNLEGQIGEMSGGNPSESEQLDTKKREEDIEEDSEEELTPEVIEKIERRKWALGFVIFGSAFTMVGAILLFVSDFDFTTFLGSCMMYVGIIALIKGVSFELQKDDNTYKDFFSLVFFLTIFFINFILLTELLDVLGNYAWAVTSTDRKFGDLLLVYLLPYIIWKLVPTFGASDNLENKDSSMIDMKSILFIAIFNYTILIITSKEYIFWPILNQYADPGFQISLYLLLITILVRMILGITYSTSKEADRPNFRQWLARRKK